MRTAFILAALLNSASPAGAAERNFGVNGFDRIRVDGPFRVTLATGVAPFAKASGSPQALDRLSIQVQGRTLVLGLNRSGWGGQPGASAGPVEVSVGTHELTAAALNSAGTLDIDKVKGLGFDLGIHGSGLARVGVAAVDQFKLNISGTGSALLGGAALNLQASLRGTASLDASAMAVKDARIDTDGPSSVRASVSNSAKVNAQGASMVELAGRPACTVKTLGSAEVRGCR